MDGSVSNRCIEARKHDDDDIFESDIETVETGSLFPGDELCLTCVSVIIVAIVSHWPGSPFTVSTAVTPVHQSDINIGWTLEISVLYYDETAYGEDTGRKRMSEIWLDMGLKWFLLILIWISSDRKNLTSLTLIHINRFKSC